MSDRAKVNQILNAMVQSGNIAYATGDTVTPASGAPGAYGQLLANAAATVAWWACALVVGNLSGAGATAFNYQIARAQDGSGTSITNTLRILLEAAAATLVSQRDLPYPVRVAAGVGAAARQTTASGKTLDVALLYATGVGS
jgi:hypothetical protein